MKRAVVSACMRAREHQSRRGIDVGDSDETRCVPDSGRVRLGARVAEMEEDNTLARAAPCRAPGTRRVRSAAPCR